MRKTFVSFVMILCILISSIFVCYSQNAYNLSLEGEEIKTFKYQITSGQGRPREIDEEYLEGNYSYSTNTPNQITYLIHYLNSFNFDDDGIVMNSSDGIYINLELVKKDSSVLTMGFSNRRFQDTTGKQYGVATDEYNRFLDFIYALKTKKIVLPDEVTFESSDWAKEEVKEAIDKGLVPKWNQINYTGTITRLEVCQLIDNLLEQRGIFQSKMIEIPFKDTADNSVNNLYCYGIINGKSEEEFCPYDYITREEFAVILDRIYNLVGIKLSLSNQIKNYADSSEISSWAKNCIKRISSIGLMQGNENNIFHPKNNISKEEVIIILLNYYDRILEVLHTEQNTTEVAA